METKLHRERRKQGEEYEKWVVEKWLEVYGKTLTRVIGQTNQYAYGDTREGVEIKNDKRMAETGNVYIETHEKANPLNEMFFPSGINCVPCKWYLVGDMKEWFVFEKHILQQVDMNNPEWVRRVQTATSKGFVIPKKWANVLAVRYHKF